MSALPKVLGLSFLVPLATSACGPPPPTAAPAAVVVAPPPPPACGSVEVDDTSVPPDPARGAAVRDATRQMLAARGACSPKYKMHINVTVEQKGTGRLEVRLRTVIYRTGGEMAADIPTKLSAEHTAPEDRAAKEAELLKNGGESVALLYIEHFH